MKYTELSLSGVWLLTPDVYEDNRGNFMESFNQKQFESETGIDSVFVQDNHSISTKKVFRGLHFQKPPYAQGKLVRVTSGAALDVFVDLRKESDTYGQCDSVVLNSENRLSLYVPEGFAHGFLALEENTHFLYKCTNLYHPESEGTIDYKSVEKLKNLITSPIINQKDEEGTDFNKFQSPF